MNHRVAIQSLHILLVCLASIIITTPGTAHDSTVVMRPVQFEREFHGLRLVSSPHTGRPKIGLVLSGGGARALSQIGVLRALEEHRIPIDLIVGNSLGSVIGGLYAAGYSIAQLESIATHADWTELLSFSEETRRTDLFVGQKQAQQEGYLVIRFDGLEPIIPSSISGGQRLSNFFSYLTLQALYHPNPSFDDLKIPFRATATDMISGRRIILDSGSLAEAMRASVTVPLLYSPLERDSMFMVDGGLTSNIPADVALSAGCDIVIVVNSTSSMRNAHQLGAPWEIADQIMTIMMQSSNNEQLKLANVVITPETGNRIVSNFDGIDSLLLAGERAGEAAIPLIERHLKEHAYTDSSRTVDQLAQSHVTFSGDSLVEEMSREVVETSLSRALSPRVIDGQLNRISALGQYRDIYAEVSGSSPAERVVYHALYNSPLAEIQFRGNKRIPDSLITARLAPFKGSIFHYREVQRAMERVVLLYRDFGYSLARVESVEVDPAKGSLRFSINEGTISQIRYEGNERTREYVIRREFPMDEGEVFRIEKASQGLVNIKSTGLFEYVLLDVRYEHNRPIMILKVKEKSAELLKLGLHADNEHNMVGTIILRDANMRGAWEELGVTARYGFRDRMVIGEYTINRIFHSYLTLNTKFYFKSRDVLTYGDSPTLTAESWDRLEDGKYRENRIGGSLTFGSHFERFGDLTAELRAERQKIDPIAGLGAASEDHHLVSIKLQTIFDTQNKFSFPTSGTYVLLSYEAAQKGLGSTFGFGKIGLTYQSYLTFLRSHTVRPRVTFGFADETLPTGEQFSFGGFGSFYGLREDDSRGRQLFLVNAEYRYSLPFKVIFETFLSVRYDLGMISEVPQELKFNRFKHGVGVEIALDTPLGIVSVGAGKSFHLRQDLPNSPVSTGPLLFYFSFGPPL